MHSLWFRSNFLSFLKFPQIKERDLISLGEPILQNGWIIWSPLLYFNLRNLNDPNSSPFIRFQCILHDSVILFSAFSNCVKLKRGETILRNGWIIWSPLLYFNFRNLRDPNSSSLIRFQCILHDFYMIPQYFCHVFEISSN